MLKTLFRIIDISLSLFFFVKIIAVSLCTKKTKTHDNKILLLSSAGDTESTYKKFGTFDFLLNYDGKDTRKHFTKNILFWFPAKNNLCLDIADDYQINEVKYNTYIPLTSYAIYLSKILHTVKSEKIPIVRAFDPYISGLTALIVSKILRVRFCISIHADYDKRYQLDKEKAVPTIYNSRTIAKLLEKLVLSHAQIVMPIRESLSEYAIRNGARPESIRLIPHGINLEPFLKSPERNFLKGFGFEGKKTVVFVGRLTKENYVYDILEVAKKVSKRRNDVIFAMVGSGGEEENLKRRVKEDKLENAVNFLGFQPQNKVIEFRKNADVNLCLMGGFSLIESCASGKPVIAYDVEWHYELIKNEETGFLIEEGNTDKVTEKIISLLNDEQLAQRLGINAQKLAIEKHSVENISKIKISIYKELLRMSQ